VPPVIRRILILHLPDQASVVIYSSRNIDRPTYVLEPKILEVTLTTTVGVMRMGFYIAYLLAAHALATLALSAARCEQCRFVSEMNA